jgi:putative lipoprotein
VWPDPFFLKRISQWQVAIRWPFGLVLVTIAPTLAGEPTLAETRYISIMVSQQEYASLPPDAVLEVELLDVSKADAPSVRVASQRLEVGDFPVTLKLPYDSAAIDDRMTYVVAARLLSGDEVIFRTVTSYPVLTRDAPASADIVMQPARREASAVTAGQRIAGVPWAAIEIGGRALIAEDPPTIAFLEDGTFSMFGGCNRFRGKALVSDGRITFPDPIVGTRRACPPQRAKLEADILDALKRTVGYERSGAGLSLTNNTRVVTARFQERPE